MYCSPGAHKCLGCGGALAGPGRLVRIRPPSVFCRSGRRVSSADAVAVCVSAVFLGEWKGFVHCLPVGGNKELKKENKKENVDPRRVGCRSVWSLDPPLFFFLAHI